MTLHGKHALITGGSRGIGRGIALKLAAARARVAVTYRSNKDTEDTLRQIRACGSDGAVIQADVTRPEDITRMVYETRTAHTRISRHELAQ